MNQNMYQNNYHQQQQMYDVNQMYMNQVMYNPSQYNINMVNKQYPNDYNMKRMTMDKENKQSYDLTITDVNELLTKIMDLCRDHNGSRLVQKMYSEANDEDKNRIFEKLFPHIQTLAIDVFGNYVIQKFFENSDKTKRKQIIKVLEGNIFDLTLHMYGCRVIQKAIEVIEVDEIRSVLKEVKKDIKRCIEDQNGNHVVQKLIEKLPKGEHTEILKIIYGNCFELSTHQYGCRVIQRVFEFCREEEKEKLLDEILSRALELISDQYGNYVIQHIVEKRGAGKCGKIYEFLRGKIYDFSIHKFASNVVEKCLSLGNNSQRKEIVDEILNREDNDSLLAMVRDKYGNYVVQKMIEHSDQKTKECIIKKISTSNALKKRDGFSKHVINFIEKMGFNPVTYQAIGNKQI
jgi:pumilio RNA-binding family